MLQLCHAFRVLGASPGAELAMLATLSNVHAFELGLNVSFCGSFVFMYCPVSRFTASAEWSRSRRQLITLLSWTQECIEAEQLHQHRRRLLFVVARAAATRLLHSRSFRSVAFCLEEAGMRQPCLKPLR
jgi:hypothetical protein